MSAPTQVIVDAIMDAIQSDEESDREAEHFENLREMFSGLPANTTTGQAAKIRAAEGSEFAIALLEHLQSDGVRLNGALTDAAAKAHPGWKLNSDGRSIQRTSQEGPETPEALLDWFQVTYPREAREIERRLIKESSGGGCSS